MAIGGDQGGSIRMPAAYCGCYGLKRTHGLVPYTGVMPIETTIDHTGPMTQNVRDNAVMLQAIAGADGLDPRQYEPQVDDYTGAIGRGAGGLRIGMVKEGFGHANSEADVDAKVRAGAELLRRLGATVDEVSIPAHLNGPAIWTPIALEGLTNQMMLGNGMGTGWKGMYTTSLLDFHANLAKPRGRAVGHPQDLHVHGAVLPQAPPRALLREGAEPRAPAPRRVRQDVRRLRPPPDADPPGQGNAASAPRRLARPCTASARSRCSRTPAPFDVTGHPAMSIPCGMGDGLPVGLMLVAARWREATIYRAAAAFEQADDWRRL